MPPFGPISRRELIRALRAAGFEGPYSGGKHPFMLNGDVTLIYRTCITATSAENCLHGFSGRRVFRGRNGKDSAEYVGSDGWPIINALRYGIHWPLLDEDMSIGGLLH